MVNIYIYNISYLAFNTKALKVSIYIHIFIYIQNTENRIKKNGTENFLIFFVSFSITILLRGHVLNIQIYHF